MAVVYPFANGNWSTVANWYSGGSPYGQLPQSGDTVYANGKTIAIDQSITVVSLNTGASSPAVAGGQFTCSITCTITASIDARNGTARVLLTDNLVGTTVTIIGNIWGGSGINAFLHNNTGTLNITGNIVGGTVGGTSAALVNTLSSAIINHTGNISATATSQCCRINCTYNLIGNITSGILNGSASFVANSQCILNVNGNISAGAGYFSLETSAGSTVNISSQQTLAGGSTAAINNSGVINLNNNLFGPLAIAGVPAAFIVNLNVCVVNGNVTMQNYSVSTTFGIISNSSSLTINGNVTGGTVANTIAINNSSTTTITVNGNITGGSNATNTPAIYSTTAGTIDVTGTTTAGLYPALYSTSLTATNILRGNIVNAAGVPAYFLYKIKISPSIAQQFTFQDTSNNNRVLATSNISPNVPIQSNVRLGVVYGSTSEYTGTMVVPNPVYVRAGVPVDVSPTIGTASLSPSDFWNYATSSITSANTIGKLLKDNVDATVSSRATQTSVNNIPANTITELSTSSVAVAERLRNVSTVQTTGDQLAAF